MKTTLVIVPHMDDEAFSCGGLIQRRVKDGGRVKVMALYGRTYSYGENAKADAKACKDEESDFVSACGVLGVSAMSFHGFTEGEPAQVGYYKVLRPIEDALTDDVEEVIIPGSRDMNQDHRFLHDACKIACRPANLKNIRRILAFRSFDCDLTRPSYFVPMTRFMLDTKIEATECYRRETRQSPHPRSSEMMESLHKVLGSYCGCKYAEGYDVVFLKE